MLKSRLLAAVGIVAVVGGIAAVPLAQAPASPAFEVASIKPHQPGPGVIAVPHLEAGGRYVATNVPLIALLVAALGPYYQIIGAPDWIAKPPGFDLVAKAGGDAASDINVFRTQASAMLRTLLEDHCRLQTHTERRQMPVYALVKNTSDGSLGSNLRHSSLNCPPPNVAPELPMDPATRGCLFHIPGVGAVAGSGQMPGIVASLTRYVDRPILDRTDLSGSFDVTLQWDPATTPGRQTSSAPQAPTGLPSFFTAVQEQLGLKLEPTTGLVDVLVIDHVEHPTEN